MKTATSALLFAFALTACSPSDSGDQKESDSGAGNPLTAPVDYLGAVNEAQKSSVKKLDLINVTQAINNFAAAEGRNPKSLQEVVDEGYLAALPEAPRGMKFDYNPATGTAQIVPAN